MDGWCGRDFFQRPGVAEHFAVVAREDDHGPIELAAVADEGDVASKDGIDSLDHRRIGTTHRAVGASIEFPEHGRERRTQVGDRGRHAFGDVHRLVRADQIDLEEPGGVAVASAKAIQPAFAHPVVLIRIVRERARNGVQVILPGTLTGPPPCQHVGDMDGVEAAHLQEGQVGLGHPCRPRLERGVLSGTVEPAGEAEPVEAGVSRRAMESVGAPVELALEQIGLAAGKHLVAG